MKPAIFFQCVPALLIMFSSVSYAQLNPLGASYYQNQFLVNPAMAGLDPGMVLNLAYSKQWSSIPGTPSTQAVTSEYGFKNVGLGLSFYGDKAGLQVWNRLTGTYAYHLRLDDSWEIHFGIAMGMASGRIDEDNINGNSSDVAIGQYNRRETYIDGDFGAAYTTERLTLQGSLPNLKTFFNQDNNRGTADRSVFFAAASYKWKPGGNRGDIFIEPKLCYRRISGLKNITDAGANFSFINNRLNLMAIYHSTGNATFGAGMQYAAFNISGMYTNETSVLRGNTNGNFEVNLRIDLFK